MSEPLIDKTIRLEYSQNNVEKGLYDGLHWFEKNAVKERDFVIALSEIEEEEAQQRH